jgi:GNAT superfamily N-acetyltransferase
MGGDRVTVRRASAAEAEAIAALVLDCFEAHIAPHYEERGRESFRAFAHPALLRARLEGDSRGWVAVAGQRLVGFLERREEHVVMLFAARGHERRGIGRRLLARALAGVAGEVTLNAAPGAVEAYHRLGFCPAGPPFEEDGLRALPMVRTLDR